MRRGGAVLLLIAIHVVCPLTAMGQSLPGYVVGDPGVLPDSLVESYHSGRFTLAVFRTAADSAELRALVVAESLLPVESVIEAAVDSTLSEMRHTGLWPRNFALAREREGPRWWWLEWEHAWLPFSVTGPAIAEYMEKMRGLAASYPHETVNDSGRFSYVASVMTNENGAHTVTMSVTWDFGAMRFEHQREVEIDRDGNPIAVRGDGPPDWATVHYR